MACVLSFSPLSLCSVCSWPSLLSLVLHRSTNRANIFLKQCTALFFFFFAVTAIATGIQLPPSRVSAAASAAPTSTVTRWTQVSVVDSSCSLMLIKSQMPAYKGGINVFDPRASSISLVILSGHCIALYVRLVSKCQL